MERLPQWVTPAALDLFAPGFLSRFLGSSPHRTIFLYCKFGVLRVEKRLGLQVGNPCNSNGTVSHHELKGKYILLLLCQRDTGLNALMISVSCQRYCSLLAKNISQVYQEIVEVLETATDYVSFNGTTYRLPLPLQPNGVKWSKIITEMGPCFASWSGRGL